MEPQTRDIGREHDVAVASVASFLREEVGVDDRTAHARANKLVDDARDAFVRSESAVTWWSIALRGVLAIVAGIIFLQRPIESVAAIVFVLGAWILVDGIISIGTAIANRDWADAPYGLIGVLVGYLIFTRPQGAITVFFILTAAWALARGAAEIGQAAKMHKGERGRASLVFLGLLSFAFGLLLIAAPVLGVVTLGWWIGAYALIDGVVSVIRSFQIRRVSHEVRQVWGRRSPQPA